ncbi:MAG: alkyl sulfatase dimerization domain-containing protein [Myxococcota bacterium]|nr:alkyl sulfatase dimerization domain-containing protein [Myxococcota bacterium]
MPSNPSSLAFCFVFSSVLAALSCGVEPSPASRPTDAEADSAGHTAATTETVQQNVDFGARLPLNDPIDFENASRGFISADPEVHITRADGRVVWSTREYAFVEGEAPDTVNPSLWRQAQLNGLHGLFEVMPGLYQVRGYDLANMTLIQGDSGWIVVDPLTSRETAAAALDLARRHLGDQPISAVIFTHSHIDHFGGVGGILPDDPAARSQIPIIAPAGFTEEATSENIIAGPIMLRRASLMYGMALERGPRGHVDTGLGKQPARGHATLALPTELVDSTPQAMVIDGVRFIFQYVPETEAPAELTFYLPDFKAFDGAEVVSHTMHNLYTLRGAKVRDALKWSNAIQQAIDLFGQAEVLLASHHWPVWGNPEVLAFLKRQRDLYKFIHDQTLRLAGQGLTPNEIAESLELPPSLAPHFGNRGYYGTLKHNSKAVYQWYFGWYDGNPAHLDPLPPEQAARRYVEALGGSQTVLEQAQKAFTAGDYRWASELLNHAVFADPKNREAREWLARTYDQLGYQAESGPWRDVYLSGAYELRHGPHQGGSNLQDAIELLREVPLDQIFDTLATRLNAGDAADSDTVIQFEFTDLGETHLLWVENAVLHHRLIEGPLENTDATVHLTHEFLLGLLTQQIGLKEALFADDLSIEGSRMALLSFFSMLDSPDEGFHIVTP